MLGVLVASAPSSGVLAVTRWDPRGDAYVDVWKTSKHTIPIVAGPDRLRIKVIATLSNDWSISVYLDTRGDRGAEYRLINFEKFGISRCNLWRLQDGDRRRVRCGRRYIDDSILLSRLWWSVPRQWLGSDKVIRWHVHTRDVGFDPRGRHDDRAPDRGWYP